MKDPAFKFAVEDDPNTADLDRLDQGLTEFNEKVSPKRDDDRFAIFARNDEGAIVAGVYCITFWQWLFVKNLWVHEDLRGHHLGSKLMQMAEDEAVRRGCKHAYTDTYSFQALPFYQNLGYTEFGSLSDCPMGASRHWLQKRNLGGK